MMYHPTRPANQMSAATVVVITISYHCSIAGNDNFLEVLFSLIWLAVLFPDDWNSSQILTRPALQWNYYMLQCVGVSPLTYEPGQV